MSPYDFIGVDGINVVAVVPGQVRGRRVWPHELKRDFFKVGSDVFEWKDVKFEFEKAEDERRAKKYLEMKDKIEVGDFVRFVKTRGAAWRKVVRIDAGVVFGIIASAPSDDKLQPYSAENPIYNAREVVKGSGNA